MSIQDDNRDNEVWKDISGYEEMYQVSNFGRVKSLKRYRRRNDKILHLANDKDGYLQVNLSRDNKSKTIKVHKLVMLTFVGERPNGFEINHIDGIKTNNHIDNLEYCTSSEKTQHAYDTGLQPSGKKHYKSKFTDSQVLEIRERHKSGRISQTKLAREYEVSPTTIHKIVKRKAWKHLNHTIEAGIEDINDV